MRIISKDGSIDLPYDLTVLSILTTREPEVAIAANVVGVNDLIYLGSYRTRDRAVNELSRLRMAYGDDKSYYRFGG